MKVILEHKEDAQAFDQIVKDLQTASAKLVDQGQFDPAARLAGHAERLKAAVPEAKKKDEKEEK